MAGLPDRCSSAALLELRDYNVSSIELGRPSSLADRHLPLAADLVDELARPAS